jgi:predicted kinase
MSTLVLICGLPGSGKTTLAKRLEAERSALRLCPDEWIAPLLKDLGDTAELHRLRDPIEALQWDIARRALALGIDVILEWGFWGREERRYYRAEADALGHAVELHYLDLPLDELWARLSKRNANLPQGTFPVSREQLEMFDGWFERPSAEELRQ